MKNANFSLFRCPPTNDNEYTGLSLANCTIEASVNWMEWFLHGLHPLFLKEDRIMIFVWRQKRGSEDSVPTQD